MPKRVLITGGCGFIGHHVVGHVVRETGWDVVSLDRMSHGTCGLRRLREVCDGGWRRVQVVGGDIASPVAPALQHEFSDGFDFIIHMAAESHVARSVADPWPFIRSNILGTAHVLDYARTLGARLFRMVNFSTDEVFGPCHDGKVPYQPHARHDPTTPYAATKSAAEQLCSAWRLSYGVPVVLTHCMNVIGERQHPEKFLPLCVRNILAGRALSIHVDARGESAVRSWTPAAWVARATVNILSTTISSPRWNIALGCEMSVLALARRVAEILERPLITEFIVPPERPNNDHRYAVKASRIPNMDGKYSFDDELRRIVLWYRDNPTWLEAE